jgi:hypothetical protein
MDNAWEDGTGITKTKPTKTALYDILRKPITAVIEYLIPSGLSSPASFGLELMGLALVRENVQPVTICCQLAGKASDLTNGKSARISEICGSV